VFSFTKYISEEDDDRLRKVLVQAISEACKTTLENNQLPVVTTRVIFIVENLHRYPLEKTRATNLLAFYENLLNARREWLKTNAAGSYRPAFYQAAIKDCGVAIEQCKALLASFSVASESKETKAAEKSPVSDWKAREQLWDRCHDELASGIQEQKSVYLLQNILKKTTREWFSSLCLETEMQLATAPCAFTVIVCGSYSRGELTLGSDLDIGIVIADESCVNDPYFSYYLQWLLWKVGIMPRDMLSIHNEQIAWIQGKDLLGTPKMFAESHFFLPEGNRAHEKLKPEMFCARYPEFVYKSHHDQLGAEQLEIEYQQRLVAFLKPEEKGHTSVQPYQRIAAWTL
jgi:predicted nucleotidyltransferase